MRTRLAGSLVVVNGAIGFITFLWSVIFLIHCQVDGIPITNNLFEFVFSFCACTVIYSVLGIIVSKDSVYSESIHKSLMQDLVLFDIGKPPKSVILRLLSDFCYKHKDCIHLGFLWVFYEIPILYSIFSLIVYFCAHGGVAEVINSLNESNNYYSLIHNAINPAFFYFIIEFVVANILLIILLEILELIRSLFS